MIHIHKFKTPVTVDASGAATVYTEPLTGVLHELRYEKDDFADGVDFTITREDTGESLWTEVNVNASTVRRPRLPTHDGTGAAMNYAATFPVNTPVMLTKERVKIVIAQGGNATSGTFHFTIETQ